MTLCLRSLLIPLYVYFTRSHLPMSRARRVVMHNLPWPQKQIVVAGSLSTVVEFVFSWAWCTASCTGIKLSPNKVACDRNWPLWKRAQAS